MIMDYLKGGKMVPKDLIRSTLKSNICKIKFTKTNGEVREMICTLKDDVVVPHEKTTDRVKAINEEVLAVWDCEKNAWRSFRFDSILEHTLYVGDINVPA